MAEHRKEQVILYCILRGLQLIKHPIELQIIRLLPHKFLETQKDQFNIHQEI
jgi:hypothetical protein